ncbi:MAG: dTDP-4-dehydrorhamnose reductase, partial [uncultured Frankineae bacterium]
ERRCVSRPVDARLPGHRDGRAAVDRLRRRRPAPRPDAVLQGPERGRARHHRPRRGGAGGRRLGVHGARRHPGLPGGRRQRRRLHRRGRRRERRGPRLRRQRDRPGAARPGLRRERRPARARQHRLRLPRRPGGRPALRRGRPDRTPVGVRPHEARRRAGRARAAPGRLLGRAHGLGLRRHGRQLRQDHGPARERAGDGERRRRPGRLADVEPRPGKGAVGAGARGRPGRHLPLHQPRRDDLARLHAGHLRGAGRRSGARPADDQRRVRPTGAPAGLQRPVAPGVGRGRSAAPARLARRTGRGLPPARQGVPARGL